MTHLMLFDVDGVCADDTHRVKYALSGDRARYFYECPFDSVLPIGRALAKYYDSVENVEVQYLTGRRVNLYKDTYEWLREEGFPNPHKLTMRGNVYQGVLAKFKCGVLRDARATGKYESVHLYDDDPEVVRYINEQLGDGHATQTLWYTKHPDLIKSANA